MAGMLVDMSSDALLPIQTERLTLRAHTEDDLEALLEYESLDVVAQYLPFHAWTRETGREHLAKRLERLGLDSPARSLGLVVEHEGRVIGDVLLWATDETGAKGRWAGPFTRRSRGTALRRRPRPRSSRSALPATGCTGSSLRWMPATRPRRESPNGSGCSWRRSRDRTTGPRGSGPTPSSMPRSRATVRMTSVTRSSSVPSSWPTPTGTCSPCASGDGLLHAPRRQAGAGEAPAQCAVREVEEELGLVLDPAHLDLVAVHRTAAANEAGRPLIATVFRHPHLSSLRRPEVVPAAEIEEVRWTDPTQPLSEDSAPLLRLVVGTKA